MDNDFETRTRAPFDAMSTLTHFDLSIFRDDANRSKRANAMTSIRLVAIHFNLGLPHLAHLGIRHRWLAFQT